MAPRSDSSASLLSGQNLWLRLLILLLVFIGALDASLRQLGAQIVLFLIFTLLDIVLYPKLFKGLRITIPFFAAYWIFGTLFQARFPDMVLFTLKLILFIIVTVYCFGNLTLQKVLQDTRVLRKRRWGEKTVHYILATGLFIRAYMKYFARNKPKGSSSIGSVLDNMLSAGKHVYAKSDVIETQLERTLQKEHPAQENSPANLIALSLLALMALIGSL